MKFRCVLFDLGGVLQRLNGLEEFRAMVGGLSEEAMWELWLSTPWVRRFERGECSPEAFAAGLVADLKIECSAEYFLDRFRAWPGRFHDGAVELVREVEKHCPVACLSNTNSLHWHGVLEGDGVGELFPMRFLSFEIGLVKPDREAYTHVLKALDLPAYAVLFLDDNRLNIEGARAVGMAAELVRGPTEARVVLARHDLAAAVAGV